MAESTLTSQYARDVSRFESAYAAWKDAPIEVVNNTGILFQASNSLIHVQETVLPLIESLDQTGLPGTPPLENSEWYGAMNFTISREQRILRALVRQGRHQIITRDLLRRSQILDELWTAYRTVIGR